MNKVLVTGADGFIGSHLVEALVHQGYAVRALSYYNSFDSRGWLDNLSTEINVAVEHMAGDVRDPSGMRQAVKGCRYVLNLAALIGIPYSYHSPDAYVDTNIRGTLNILQAVRDFDVERCVQTSTSEVYGTAQYVPIDEVHPLQGQSPYAATKIGADQLALSFHRSFSTPVTVLRPFNTYGPRQSTRAVIPTIITQIAAGGRTLSLGALDPTRDFSYVADTAQGFIAAMTAGECALGEVINVGSGFEISIGDTAALIAETMGVNVEVKLAEERIRPKASEVERLWAATEKADRLLDWRPTYVGRDGFKRGVAETARWFTDPDNLARYRVGTYTI